MKMDGHWPYPWTWLQKLECLKFHHLFLKKMELGSRNRKLTSVTGEGEKENRQKEIEKTLQELRNCPI